MLLNALYNKNKNKTLCVKACVNLIVYLFTYCTVCFSRCRLEMRHSHKKYKNKNKNKLYWRSRVVFVAAIVQRSKEVFTFDLCDINSSQFYCPISTFAHSFVTVNAKSFPSQWTANQRLKVSSV